MTRADHYMDEVRKLFPHAVLGKDGKSKELCFSEDEK